ncbi:hypothetical protein SAMN05428988_0424 [Chitinophaga sp. YR573]|uniref:hypothetical protein n=1 Tax=Chitinophaga sp. YR573 TaxID=1881040 RepID=UPI0008C174DD|nr:hypothetical protein [Chitinophaga sp. YR573]SEV91700.1 hypothetical protein SAMN05428988_0424 [Chitinophaga sp. YR573]
MNKAITGTPPTIPLDEAIKRAATWRDQVSKLSSDDSRSETPLLPPQLIFRAININMSDIDWLKRQHPDAKSVRLYLSIPDPAFPLQICGMLVPVDAQNQDILTQNIDKNASMEEILKSVVTSTIYDFTQPCPTMCNTPSPLFSDTNNIDPYLRYKK